MIWEARKRGSICRGENGYMMVKIDARIDYDPADEITVSKELLSIKI